MSRRNNDTIARLKNAADSAKAEAEAFARVYGERDHQARKAARLAREAKAALLAALASQQRKAALNQICIHRGKPRWRAGATMGRPGAPVKAELWSSLRQ